MVRYSWNAEKNRALKSDARRNICFEDIVAAIEAGALLADIAHPNTGKYPNQRVLVVPVNEYVYAVPYVRTRNDIFLKTAFQSRRLKDKYLPEGR
jgi:hypothetical protein